MKTVYESVGQCHRFIASRMAVRLENIKKKKTNKKKKTIMDRNQ